MEGGDLSEFVEWPSERVKPGGVFHPPKITYSKETHNLIKEFMEEQKLTMLQRNKIKYHLRNGESLPLPDMNRPKPRPIASGDELQQAYEIIMRAKSNHKRPLNTIKASGAYEIPKFVPRFLNRETSEKAKIRLQEIMSGIKHQDSSGLKIKNKYKFKRNFVEPEYVNPIDTLLEEIYERADWLAEMEELGEGKKHRDVIQGQIAERLREIKRLEYSQEREYESMQRLQMEIEKQKNIPPEGNNSEIMSTRSDRSSKSRTKSVERPSSKASSKSRAKSCVSARSSVMSTARHSVKSKLPSNQGSVHSSINGSIHGSNHRSIHDCDLGSIQGSNYESLHGSKRASSEKEN